MTPPDDISEGVPSMTGPRVYVSVDMEGIAGISRVENVAPGHSTYSRGQVLMVEEANAAVRGAFDAGASAVVVADSHGPMDNLPPDLLDPRASLLNGSPRPCGMAEGLERSFDAALFIGYHAAAGSTGVLSHTFTPFWTDFRLNGSTASEADVNALAASEHGVPVKLMTGDDQICEAGIRGVDGLRTVQVKRSLSWTSAESLAPSEARARIHEAARAAVADETIAPATQPGNLTVELDLRSPAYADVIELVPTVRRLTALTVSVDCSDAAGIHRFVTVASFLATSATPSPIR
jgi:D-amino peptidase